MYMWGYVHVTCKLLIINVDIIGTINNVQSGNRNNMSDKLCAGMYKTPNKYRYIVQVFAQKG